MRNYKLKCKKAKESMRNIGLCVLSTIFLLLLSLVFTMQSVLAASYSVASEYDSLPYSTITNCVAFARYKVPSLPTGLVSLQDKKNIINSNVAQVGAIAITSGNSTSGHVAYVEAISGSQITTLNGGFCDSNGNYTGHIERITGTVAEQGILGYWMPNASSDTTPPQISNYQVTNITKTSFTIEATVTDNVGVAMGEFMVWSDNNGQDDMNGNKGTISGNKITCTINISDHNNDKGYYFCDLYLYDASGNKSSKRLSIYIGDEEIPNISDYKVTKITNAYFTVEATVTDNIGVKAGEFMVWSDNNGQDDLKGHYGTITGNKITCTINLSEHNNDVGQYYCDLYLYDTSGNVASKRINNIIVGDTEKPVISDYKLVEKTDTYFVVTATVTDNSQVTLGEFMVWSDNNGQDDMIGHYGTINGDTITCKINISDHNNDKGLYFSDLYLYDAAGNVSSKRLEHIFIGDCTHNWTDEKVIKKATCEETGEVEYTCSICMETKTEITAQTGHSWDKGIVIKEASVISGGEKIYTCENCTVTRTETIPKLPSMVNDETKESNNQNDDNDSLTKGESDDDTDVIQSISLNGISNIIAAGKKIKLNVVIVPADAANQTLIWKSSNPKYATVSSNGLVTTKKKGVGKTVTISAATKDGSDIVATYKIKIVKDAVKSVKITAKSKTVKAGKKLSLKASVKATGKSANKTLTWSSSNTKYATVSKKGVVKTTNQGKGKTVKITAKATDGTGKKAVIIIRIK